MQETTNNAPTIPTAPTKNFDTFLIERGWHFANNDSNRFEIVDTNIIRFQVRFDSSAIYKTVLPSNQTDVNKLYGFSDNAKHHHHFSARIGWAYFDNALRLFGYVYNDSLRTITPITTVAINTTLQCSIATTANSYIFMVNNTQLIMPRTATTPRALGYKLFPYFGGDEPAPQRVKILIKEE
jgi:hypothetical protein